MKLQKSNRSQAKIRIAILGPSGSGKTYSSLLLAFGLCGNWNKIAIIDSEHQSASLYSHLGDYNVLCLDPPYNPERYIEAIRLCEAEGIEVIIIDSISHEWEGPGGIIDIHSSMAGNSFTNWSKLTPRHNSLVQKILNSTAHVIATVRSKQDYVLTDKNGKQVPEKVGLKGIQRDGLEYDFSLVFEIDINHGATCSKDRTQLFSSQKTPFVIDQGIGQKIKSWCENGSRIPSSGIFGIEEEINAIDSLENLHKLYREKGEGEKYLDLFTKRAEELRKPKPLFNPMNFGRNGSY
ncbi:AAA family ATPase [Algoriphagus confluentis]|uniref:AAA family ATPase n=1 Tax=Algoriphagus confluentis TaxID=1697556 RepID=A0ABQ6PU40_9BACT|nr:AAA family ATPase [Algoriphagus confluentis]